MFDAAVHFVQSVAVKLAAMFAADVVISALAYSAAFAAVAIAIEIVFVGWKRSALRKLVVRPSRSTITDFLVYMLGALQITWLIGGLMTAGLLFAFTKLVGPVVALDLGLYMPPLAHALALLVIFDFFEYWFHRFSHETEALWQIHQFHHAAEEMTVFTVGRIHPVETAIRLVGYTLIGALLGASPLELIPIVYGRAVLAALKHSDVDWRWGAFGGWVLQSPHLHRVHHARAQEFHHCNYAILFSFWDRMFGSFMDSDQHEAIGVEESPLNRSHMIADMWICYAGFMRVLVRPLRRLWPRRRAVAESDAAAETISP